VVVKSAEAVVFTGQTYTEDASKSSQTTNTTPPYEDAGVKYQGYSKRLVGSNQYLITPQARIYIKDDDANTTADQLAYTVPNGKKLFINTIAMFCYDSAATYSTTRIYDGSSSIPSVFRGTVGSVQTIVWKFDVPIQFNNSVIWKMGDNKTQIYLDMWGWLEDI
jgi:hypothetical protein